MSYRIFRTIALSLVGLVIISIALIAFRQFSITKGLDNPLEHVSGAFLEKQDFTGDDARKTVYACANDLAHAKQLLQDHAASVLLWSGGDLSAFISGLEIDAFREYFSATFSEKLNNADSMNVFKCDYFVHEPMFYEEKGVNKWVLGTYNGELTSENVTNLVWLLMEAQVINLYGFNQSIEIVSVETLETEEAFVRTDTALLLSHNDIPPFNTYSSDVVYVYRLDKNTKELSYTRVMGE